MPKPALDLDPRLTPARGDLAADFLRAVVQADRYAKGEKMRVLSNICPLHGQPDRSAERATELLFGEEFVVYERKAGWAWGQSTLDDYVGYVPEAALAPADSAATHRVGALRTFVYANADLKSPMAGALSFGAQVSLPQVPGPGEFAEMAGGGFVFADHLAPIDGAEQDYLTTAVKFIGTPYLWGGRSSLGLDCSALVQLSLQAAGLFCPRDSDMQGTALGDAVDPDPANCQPGDLVFFPSHVGIMLDTQTVLHANAWDMQVSPHPLAHVIAEVEKKYDEGLTAIRRLV